MKELRKKLRAWISFISGELMIFGVSAVFADITPGIPLSVEAKFLGCCVFFHLAAAWIELKTLKKTLKPSLGYLDAKI